MGDSPMTAAERGRALLREWRAGVTCIRPEREPRAAPEAPDLDCCRIPLPGAGSPAPDEGAFPMPYPQRAA